MSDKQVAIERLNEIHSTLVDKEKFLPYNYNILILWGVISAVLFLTFERVASFGVVYSVGYILGFVLLGTLVEYYFMKIENSKYDLSNLTKTQKFIESIYGFSTVFGGFMTYLFLQNDLVSYAYIIWIFLLGLNKFMIGFAINQKRFQRAGILSISISFILFLTSLYGIDTKEVGKYLAVIFVSGGCVYLGIVTKREQKSV